MPGEGCRRLWELVKWLASIGVGISCFITLIPKNPLPAEAAPSAGQILIGVLFASGIAGGATYILLNSFEWVYRGFRPLPIAPTEADQPPPVDVPEASQEARLALGHQEIQQTPSVSPTPLQKPVQRE